MDTIAWLNVTYVMTFARYGFVISCLSRRYLPVLCVRHSAVRLRLRLLVSPGTFSSTSDVLHGVQGFANHVLESYEVPTEWSALIKQA